MGNETDIFDSASDPIDMITQIVMGIIVLSVYAIGIFVNTKILTALKKDKGMTWKLDIFNSSMLIFHFGHVIFMHSVTYLVKDLYVYTGPWFCYVSKAIILYGNAHCSGHSLIIAVMKYVFIVQWKWALNFGEDKVKKIFFWINIFYPVYVFAIFNIVRPDFLVVYEGISHSNRCLGKSEMFSSQDNKLSARKLHNMCDIDEPLDVVSFSYMVYIARKSICWLHVIFTYSNVWNVLDAIIYFRVFYFMRRWVVRINDCFNDTSLYNLRSTF